MPQLVTALRSTFGEQRRERRQLARELSDFRTPAEQAELESMIERLSNDDADQVRETLRISA
jgi:hypothetical protein